MNRFKLTLEYLGTHFHGWQRQKNKISIQEILENALYNLFQENIKTVVAGRTDAGVHAKGQVVHFDTTKTLSEDKLLLGANYYLLKEYNGKDVCIRKALKTNNIFNARFSVKRKTYHYIIANDFVRTPFLSDRSWFISKKLNLKKMKLAADNLIGKHDFSSFRAKGCQASSPLKTLDDVKITKVKNIIKINFTARSFLYNQVRIMVGTLKEVGLEKIDPFEIKNILKKKDRSLAGVTAPPKGLTLEKICYK